MSFHPCSVFGNVGLSIFNLVDSCLLSLLKGTNLETRMSSILQFPYRLSFKREVSWLYYAFCEGSFCWWICHLAIIRLARILSLSDANHLNCPTTLTLPTATSPLVQPSALLAFANLKPR